MRKVRKKPVVVRFDGQSPVVELTAQPLDVVVAALIVRFAVFEPETSIVWKTSPDKINVDLNEIIHYH